MKQLLLFLALILTWTGWCQAHSLYIQSSRYHVAEGKKSPLFFCYGHHIPTDDGVRGSKLKAVRVFPPMGDPSDIKVRDETGLHSYMVDYNTPGTWMLTAETTPGYYTVYTDKRGRERHTIKPMSKIRDQAVEVHKALYAKQYTKTYVACKAPSNAPLPRAGLALELMPHTDPFTLKPGDVLKMEVLRQGRPYEGKGTWDATYSGYSTRSEDFFHPKTEVSGSRFDVSLPRAGRWFIRYFIKIPAPETDRDNYKQLKLTATMVVQVENPEKETSGPGNN